MKPTLWAVAVWMAAWQVATATAATLSNAVAVLDFAVEGSPGEATNWTVGLEDYVELALQREGVPTLERRQIRLVLGERDLDSRGLIVAGTMQSAKLPSVTYFVAGNVGQTASNGFALTFSLIDAQAATAKATWTRRGRYSEDWLAAIQLLAKEAAKSLQEVRTSQPARSESEALTWLPEAALLFFRGLDYYSRGDYWQAIPWFRRAIEKENHFDLARQWEVRATRMAGFPELAEILSKLVTNVPAIQPAGTNSRGNLPVVAVIASDRVSGTGRAAFVQTLARNGRFTVFEPASIGATAREIDLQLTGQMAAPLNERSVWLVVDSVVLLDVQAGALRAGQCELLSGRPTRQAAIPASAGSGDDAYTALATAFLRAEGSAASDGPSFSSKSVPEDIELNSFDWTDATFATTLRLTQAHPDNARYLVFLSDYYSEWGSKMWFLNEAVRAVDRNRDQRDASFWLASALWRKRVMSRQVSRYFDAPAYSETPLTNDFAPLLKWFPDSPEALTLAERTFGGGRYTYSVPTDGRFLFVVPVRTEPPVPPPIQSASDPQLEARRLARLRECRQQGENAKALLLANSLLQSSVPEVLTEAERAHNELLALLAEQGGRYKSFVEACEQNNEERAWALSGPLLNAVSREQRLEVIKRCGQLTLKAGGVEAYSRFVFEQAERYKEDFTLDPVTGAPLTDVVKYNLGDASGQSNRLANLIFAEHGYPALIGELVATAQANARLDLAVRALEALRRNEALPAPYQMTAAYDLAVVEYDQGRPFEALDLLNEVLRLTEGTGMPQARGRGISTMPSLWSVAMDLTTRIRLYADRELDYSQCCGAVPLTPLPKPANYDEGNRFLVELRNRVRGGLPAGSPSTEQLLSGRQDELLPVLLYKLQRREDAAQMLPLCGYWRTNATVVLPYFARSICHGDRIECSNAIWALRRLGRAAAGAMPILILASEDPAATANTRSASSAINEVGQAPRRVMPFLARLLYHNSPAVCEKGAQAVVETANLESGRFSGMSGERLVLAVREWWEDQGSKQRWTD